jgi:hypothetical protein
MNIKKYQSLLEVLLVSVAAFLMHQLFFWCFRNDQKTSELYYSLLELYGFFLVCSLCIVFLLILTKSKSIDNVGYTFLLLTCIKMAIAYVFLMPILNTEVQNGTFEKGNFFFVFALFLAIETIVTIRILNNNQ